MFGFTNIEKDIEILQGYINIHNSIYQEDTFKSEIEEFDKKYYDYHVKYTAGIKGYERYSDKYIFYKRASFFQKLFDGYSGMHSISRALKFYLLSNDKKVFERANMTLGKNRDELTVVEFLLNEEAADSALRNLKLRKQASDVYRKK